MRWRPGGRPEAPQPVQAAQQPCLRAHEPRAGQQHEDDRAASRALRLERRGPHDEGQVRDVDVGARGQEGEVEARAQQGGGRQADERPERGCRQAVQAGGEHDERRQRRADHDPVGRIADDREHHPEGDGERMLGRRAVAVEGRLDPVQQLAPPQQGVVAVVVRIGRVDEEPDHGAQREDDQREHRPRPEPVAAAGSRVRARGRPGDRRARHVGYWAPASVRRRPLCTPRRPDPPA